MNSIRRAEITLELEIVWCYFFEIISILWFPGGSNLLVGDKFGFDFLMDSIVVLILEKVLIGYI